MTQKQPDRLAPQTRPEDLRTDPERGTGELGQESLDPRKPLEPPKQEQRQGQDGSRGTQRG